MFYVCPSFCLPSAILEVFVLLWFDLLGLYLIAAPSKNIYRIELHIEVFEWKFCFYNSLCVITISKHFFNALFAQSAFEHHTDALFVCLFVCVTKI